MGTHWYANILFVRPQHLVLCVSERTLLPVLVPAKDLRALPTRLTFGLRAVLLKVGVPETAIERELAAMQDVAIARTANRQVLGMMNDFVFMLRHYGEREPDLTAITLWLAETPCRPIGMEHPARAALAAFEATNVVPLRPRTQ